MNLEGDAGDVRTPQSVVIEESERLSLEADFSCGLSSSDSNSDQRKRQEELKRKRYSCPQCDELFDGYLLYEDHQLKHRLGLICPICGYVAATKEMMGGHERSHRNRKSIQCLLCKERLVEEKQLEKHIGKHVMSLSSCPWCPFRSEQVNALKEHIDNHLQAKRVNCSLCKYYSFNPDDLKVHVEMHAGQHRMPKFPARRRPQLSVADTTCCEEAVPVAANKTASPATQTINFNKLLPRAIFKCCICGKYSKSDTRLQEHMHTHMKPGIFYCPYCVHYTEDKEEIFIHVFSHLKVVNKSKIK